MNDKKIKQLFDFQKFEKNSSLEFVIQGAHAFVEKQSKLKLQTTAVELFDDDLDQLSAAGIQHPLKIEKRM